MVFSNKILFENSNKRKNFLIFSIEGNDSKYYTKIAKKNFRIILKNHIFSKKEFSFSKIY